MSRGAGSPVILKLVRQIVLCHSYVHEGLTEQNSYRRSGLFRSAGDKIPCSDTIAKDKASFTGMVVRSRMFPWRLCILVEAETVANVPLVVLVFGVEWRV